MGEPVQIEFQSRGVRELSSAFEGIEARMRKLGQSEAAVAENSIKATDRAASAKERAYQRVAKEAERWQKEAVKAAEQAAKAEVAAAEQATKAEERARMDAAKRGAQIIKDGVKATELAEKEKTRAVEREAARREAIQRRSSLMAGQLAEREAREVIQHREKMSRMLGGTAGRSIGGVLSSGVQMAGAALTIGGGFAIANAMHNRVSAEKAATDLQNSALIAGSQTTTSDIMGRALAVQAKTGMDKADLIKGWQSYVKLSSDFGSGDRNLEGFAKLAVGTNTDFSELMTMAGNMKVQNKNLSDSQMMGLLRNTIGQGGKGAMELEDLAKYGGEITSTAGQYGGDQGRNQQRLLGLSQVVRTVTDAAGSATAVKRLASDVSSNAGKMERAGIKVRDANGLLDPAEIVANLMEHTGGDTGKLKKLGIGRETMNIFNAERSIFNDAGGGAGGAAAVRGHIQGLENAGLTQEKADELFANQMNTKAEKFSVALEHVQQSLETALLPFIEKLADKAPQLAEALGKDIEAAGKFAEYILDNPIKGIGALILAKVGADLAQAAIGEGVKMALQTSLGQMAGKGGLIVGTATMAIALGMIAIDQVANKDVENQRRAAVNTATTGAATQAITEAVNAGQITSLSDEQVSKYEQRKKEIEQEYSHTIEGKEHSRNLGVKFEGLHEDIFDIITGGNRAAAEKPEVASLKKEYAEINEAISRAGKSHEDAATKAAKAFGDAGTAAGKLAIELGKVKAPPGAGGPPGTHPARTTPIGHR